MMERISDIKTAMHRPVFDTYLDLFYKNFEIIPDAVAVKAGNRSLTYSDLYKKVNQLANFLAKNGAMSDMLIGVSAERSLEMIVSLLAIHKIGAAYVPLDPAYPADRLKYMIEDSGLKMILSDRTSHFVIPNDKIKTIDITRMAANIESEKTDYPRGHTKPESLAYVIFTSGSTGPPKGVMVTHLNLLSFVKLVSRVLPVADDDVYLQSASITYAVSVRQIFVSLSYGLKMVVASSSAIQDPIELFKLIRDERITLIDFVPSHWRSCIIALKSLPERKRVDLLKNNLRRIVTVGESLLPDLPLEWREQLRHPAQIVNIFGQTETTGVITTCDISKAPLDDLKAVSIGRPIPETQIYILDPGSLTQVKNGEIGELCVSNPCVAKGYLNNPFLTAAKFVPNPFDKKSGNFLYRTGDLAQFSAEGSIEYLGRSDQQVKIRGMRVNLGEIEAIILKSEAIHEAVVVPQNRAKYGEVLVAFLTAKGSQEIDEDELRKSIRAKLPVHMVPVHFLTLPELPRNPNGKINRKELMHYRVQPKEANCQAQASLTDCEQKLLSIWKRLLKIDTIQTTDNFFDDLGGDSLLAVILFIEIEKEFGKNLAVSTLYRAPTIEKISRLLKSQDEDREFQSLVPIKPSGTGPPLFLVHGAGGNVLIYRDLSKHLLDNMPIYGLQSYGLEDATYPSTTVEEMAHAYVHEVKKLQPSGPYFLCGYCMGGTVALEMAQQLRSQGDAVAFLGMLETHNWSQLPPRSIFVKAKFLSEKWLFHWKNFCLLSKFRRISFLRNKLGELRRRTRIWVGTVLSVVSKNRGAKRNSLVRQSEIWKLNDRACFNYKAGYYDGRLTVFLPQKKYSVHSVSEAAWNRNHAREIDEIILPFYPAGMLVEPFVRELAETIKKKINEVIPRGTDPLPNKEDAFNPQKARQTIEVCPPRFDCGISPERPSPSHVCRVLSGMKN